MYAQKDLSRFEEYVTDYGDYGIYDGFTNQITGFFADIKEEIDEILDRLSGLKEITEEQCQLAYYLKWCELTNGTEDNPFAFAFIDDKVYTAREVEAMF